MEGKSCLKCKHHDLIVYPLGVSVICKICTDIFKEICTNIDFTHDELEIALKICGNKCDKYV
jgi:hypothetical protein